MSYDSDSTSTKAADKIKAFFLTANPSISGAYADSVNLGTMKAFARGILDALSEDETGFNLAPMTGDGAIGAVSGSYISAGGGGINLISSTSAAAATSGTVSFGSTLISPVVTANLVASSGASKFEVISVTATGFSWKSSDGSSLSGTIHFHARGS